MATVNIQKRLDETDLPPDVSETEIEDALAIPQLRATRFECREFAENQPAALRLTPAIRSANERPAFLQQCLLFRGLSLAECGEIASLAREVRYDRRQTVFREGDAVNSVSVMVSGRAKITQLSRSGGEVILRVKGSGEVLGGLGMAPGALQFLTAQTLDPCVLLVWESRRFELLEDKFPALRRNTVRIFAEHLRTLEEQFLELATEQVAPRLARMLVRLLEQASGDARNSIRIDLSREELAQMTGTTLFTVSRLLCDWEERGIIQTQRKAVVICNSRSLMALAESHCASAL
jgi:CRP/FNR family transcriptional regulator, nitrogen oxide reductase regulator